MSVVDFMFRKAGEVFNFTKDRLRLLVPSAKRLVKRETRTPCTDRLKNDTIPLYA